MGSPLSPALTQLPAIFLVSSEVEGDSCWLQGGEVGWERQNPQGKLAQISCENEERSLFSSLPLQINI